MGLCRSKNEWESLERVLQHTSTLPKSPLFGKRIPAIVTEVKDGDTLGAVLRFHGTVYHFTIRLYGIDAPERKGKTSEEQKAALHATLKLQDFLAQTQNRVMLEFVPVFDKYARRHLCHVEVGDVNVSQWMLAQRYAYPYNGRTKLAFGTYPFQFQ